MFDSHAHVAFHQFDDDRDEVIARAERAGVVGWIEIGTDLTQSQKAIELAQKHENVWATVGVHPSDIAELDEKAWGELESMLADENVVAVGEVGLDYYRGGTKEEQLPALERFVQLAKEHSLPIVFHVRDGERSAHNDLIEFLQNMSDPKRPAGVIHTFSGNQEQAKEYLDLGLHLSFSGVVTFKNAGDIAEVAATAPLDRILIETDCPFLAPEPYRSKRNEPAYVALVAQKIAELRDISTDEIAIATANNTHALFQFS